MRVLRRLHPSIDFMTQLTNHSPPGFGAQTKKSSRWFWGSNYQTIATGFEGQIRKPEATGFEVKPGETINLGFEAKRINPHSSSPCARCRSYKISPDLLIVWPPSIRSVLYHPRSSASGLLLLARSLSLPDMPHLSPAHHETNKHDSPTKIENKGWTSETFWIRIQIKISQWLITIKSMYWPLGFSFNNIENPRALQVGEGWYKDQTKETDVLSSGKLDG
jgi:hypothetical protein